METLQWIPQKPYFPSLQSRLSTRHGLIARNRRSKQTTPSRLCRLNPSDPTSSCHAASNSQITSQVIRQSAAVIVSGAFGKEIHSLGLTADAHRHLQTSQTARPHSMFTLRNPNPANKPHISNPAPFFSISCGKFEIHHSVRTYLPGPPRIHRAPKFVEGKPKCLERRK